MKFTLDAYVDLLDVLVEQGYQVTNYQDENKYNKCVILRHDVDFNLQQAYLMAETEHKHGISSTYFFLATSNFYNVYSENNRKIIHELCDMGHFIGLHFDETAYPNDIGSVYKIKQHISKELNVLEEILNININVVSYHRPSQAILEANIGIPNVINSYGNYFFRQYKYLSDSRMCWREPVLDIIRRKIYPKLHILVHPFWYYNEEKSIKDILTDFLNKAALDRYVNINDNFTNLNEIISWEEH